MGSAEDRFMDDLLAEFLAETVENAEASRRCAAADTAGAVFRMAATIGASAQFLEISRLQQVAGAAEALAAGVRDGRILAAPEMQNLLLAAVGRIEEIARAMLAGGEQPCGSDEELVHRLANAAGEAAPVIKVNAFDSSLRPNMGSELSAESPPRLRVIVGGGNQEGARNETLPDRR